jgi:hypothetical protein
VTSGDEYIVVQFPDRPTEAAQSVLALNQEGNAVVFGITKVMRAYLREEKTVLKIGTPEFTTLEMNGASVPYHIIPDQKSVEIINGLRPSEVAPVTVTSAIA